MIILGLETSCDETSAAIIENNPNKKSVKILSNIIATSLSIHAKTGGIIPETAAREQLKFIIPVIEQALIEAKIINNKSSIINASSIDAIAVTYGPGLIGSLLVGVETAKTLSFVWKKPIIPVNHLFGHIYANFIGNNSIEFPAIALIVSGGHTDLVLIKNHGDIKWLGGTRDDAAGEAFDKIGRLLGLPYPGGPAIEKYAKKGNPKAFNFPRPMVSSDNFDFSFSGLKAAVFREVQIINNQSSIINVPDICASVQEAVIDVLVEKTLKAAQKYKAKSILLGGGVAANQKLRDELELNARRYLLDAKIFCPPKNLCTDNAAMIASAAFYNNKEMPWQKIMADPELYFD